RCPYTTLFRREVRRRADRRGNARRCRAAAGAGIRGDVAVQQGHAGQTAPALLGAGAGDPGVAHRDRRGPAVVAGARRVRLDAGIGRLMQSKKDQVQAYFYVVGRLVAAVVHGKPDVLVQPNRRLNTGTMFGVIIGLIIAGICGVVGLFLPGGNDSWRMPGAIVMNEDTGARYVFLNGELRPVLNYSSARLASGGNGAIHEVSQ